MTAEQQLKSFLSRYQPSMAAEAKKCHAKLRKLVPNAVEMVYDNYNALVIGFCPGMRPSEAIVSIAVRPQWVSLCFLQAKGLPDPTKRLLGSGSVARHIRLESGAATLDDPDVRALVSAAVKRAKVAIPAGQKSRLIIKSISAKQRSRQPSSPRTIKNRE
jgi:hypothetical protein